MPTLIHRSFEVDLSVDAAWRHLAHVTGWPSWARHIRRIDVNPPGALTAASVGIIHLTNGVKSTFRVTTFDPPRRWTWAGRFLWLDVCYDHEFEPIGKRKSRLVWSVIVTGWGSSTLGRLFAFAYRRDLDRAIPRLVMDVRGIASASSP
jgi:hypothetical protein